MTTETWIITADDAGERLDKFAATQIEMTRAAVQNLVENGHVHVNGAVAQKNYRLRIGDELTVVVPDPVIYTATPENIPLDIVYEDDDLLVVNKPKGMVVHPAAGNYEGTLVNALLYHCRDSLSGINGVLRPGIVHRIDKDTSGLLIVAKNDRAHQGLAEQIKVHSFTRIYEAVVYGNMPTDTGVVDAPIGRHPTQRKKMTVIATNSKPAVTHYEVLTRFPGSATRDAFSHLRLQLETGRTHQIRVHMSSIGHPVVGDAVYGPDKYQKELQGQCLHARTIGFIHPISGAYMEFTSEMPLYFQNFLQKLSRDI